MIPFTVSLLLLWLVTSFSQAKVTEKEYASMPEIFYVDNFDNCMLHDDEALFCSFTYSLHPVNVTSVPKIWRIIEEVSRDPYNYRHDKLRHWICVPNKCSNIKPSNVDKEAIKTQINECYDEKFVHFGLKGSVAELSCQTKISTYSVDWIDVTYAAVVMAYIALILYSTIHEGCMSYASSEEYNRYISTRRGQLFNAFSIRKNWIRLVTVNISPDMKKLRHIQGLRVFNMVLVILTHTVMTYIIVPVSNTTYIEKMVDNPATPFLSSGPLCVSTFFMVSSFLLSYGLFEHFKDKTEISYKFLAIAVVNRYARLTPTLLLLVGYNATWLRHSGHGPFWNAIVGSEYLRCKKNWWLNILYINNLFDRDNMCFHSTWYLALDTQYFIITLLLLRTIKKYERHTWFILGSCVAVIIAASFIENYSYGFPALILPIAENAYMLRSYTLNNLHWHHHMASPIGNLAPALMGIGYGYYFHKYRNYRFFTTKFKVTLWWIFSWGMALMVILLAGTLTLNRDDRQYPFWASLHVATCRPLFTLGIIIGIHGVSEGIGWVTRLVLEWRPTYVLGRLSYSAYLGHLPLLLLRPALSRYPVFISEFNIIMSLIGDVAIAYAAATFLTLFVEMPVSEMIKTTISYKTSAKIEDYVTTIRKSKKK